MKKMLLSIFMFVISIQSIFAMKVKSAEAKNKLNVLLCEAAEAGACEKIKALVKEGAEPNAQTLLPSGRITPFMCALWSGQEKAARMLLKSGADVNLKSGPFKPSPLMAACHHNLALCQLIIDNGGDLFAQDDENHTALYHATQPFNEESYLICKMLLEKGVCAQTADLQALLKAKDTKTLNLLFSYGASSKGYLVEMVSYTPEEIINVILKHGAHADELNNRGNTALIEAAKSHNSENCELLVTHQKQINAQVKALLLSLYRLKKDTHGKMNMVAVVLYNEFATLLLPYFHYVPLVKLLNMRDKQGKCALDYRKLECLDIAWHQQGYPELQRFLQQDPDIRRCQTPKCPFAYSLEQASWGGLILRYIVGEPTIACPLCQKAPLNAASNSSRDQLLNNIEQQMFLR